MPIRRRASIAFDAAEARRLLRERTGRARVVRTGRGACAIWATLRALDLHERAVLLPANTCYIVLWAVLQSGNLPCLVDVDPLTGNVSPETLDRCGVADPAAIIPAHMYGLPAPMAAICAWARERDAFVLEDAALALGTVADGRAAGSWGDASVFSFGPGKLADAGLGGALLTDDAALAAEVERAQSDLPVWDNRLRALNRQWLEIYWALHQFETDNPRLPGLYPALFDLFGEITRCRLPDEGARALRTALAGLDAEFEHRRALAALYDARLAGIAARTLQGPDGGVLWRYPLLVPADRRDALLQALWDARIFDATRWYPSLQPMRAALVPGAASAPTPNADQMAAEIVNLPLGPETDQTLAEKVAAVVARFFEAE